MITVNGETMTWREGMTVQDIINEKNFTFRMLAVWVNDVAVPRTDFKNFKVPSQAKVQVVHMISGG